MRARRLIAAGVLTAATFSSTVAGLAISGTLDKAFAASPPQCNPRPVSGPVSGPVQNPGQRGQNPGQKGQNAQCRPPLTLAALDTSIEGTGTTSFSVTNLDSNAAGAAGTETLQANSNISSTTLNCSPYQFCVEVTGTFTITTGAGTLSGPATGAFGGDFISSRQTALIAGVLNLTVTSATGRFTGTTGNLFVALQYPTFGSDFFNGTISTSATAP